MNTQINEDFGKEIEIPEGWGISLLQEICHKIKSGGTPKSTQKDYYDGDISFTTITDITNSQRYLQKTIKTITKKGLENSNAWVVPKNSILYSMYATVGKPIINKIDTATHQGILGILVNKEKIDNDFLCLALEYIRPTLKKIFLTNTQSNINLEIAKNLKITHPEKIQEQQKIAIILSNIDSMMSQIQKETELMQRLRNGLMQNLLTKGINHTKFKKIKWLFGKKITIPESWISVGLSKICKIIDTPHYTSPTTNNGIPVITTADCKNEGKIDYSNVRFTSYEEYEKRRNMIDPEVGDVLFTREAPLGISVLVDKKEIAVGQRIILLKLATGLSCTYLVNFLNSYLGRLQSNSFSIKTTVERVNISDIKKFKILVPPMPEQKEIAIILSNIDSQIQSQIQHKEKLEILKKGLMQKLLTGQIRVPLI